MRVGQWVCYNDENDADRDALVTAIHGNEAYPTIDVVLVDSSGRTEGKTSVQHRSALLETKAENNELRKKRGKPQIVERDVTRRKSGAFWRD